MDRGLFKSKYLQGTMIALLLLFLAACGDSNAAPAKEENIENEDAEVNDVSAEDTEEETDAEDEPKWSEIKKKYEELEEVKPIEVLSGDTVIVEGENGTETVHLALIDAPDLILPDGTEDQEFGMLAYKQLLYGELPDQVRMERSETQNHPEGHTLGIFWVPDGAYYISINELLVAKGYTRVDRDMGSHPELLEKLEEYEVHAKEEAEGLGEHGHTIWSTPGYVTDNGFDPSVLR